MSTFTLSTLIFILMGGGWISHIAISEGSPLSHLASSPESQLVSHLLEEDEEILQERNEIEMFGDLQINSIPIPANEKISEEQISQQLDKEREKLYRKQEAVKLPAYLQDNFGGGIGVMQENGGNDDEDKPLARVWLPVEIRVGDGYLDPLSPNGSSMLTLSVIFQQTQPLGNFLRAEIVLTSKNMSSSLNSVEGDLLDINPSAEPLKNANLRLQALVKSLQNDATNHTSNSTSTSTQEEEVWIEHSSPEGRLGRVDDIFDISQPSQQKYYVLDITQLLTSNYANALSTLDILPHPHKIMVQLDLTLLDDSSDEFLLQSLFDLQSVERPFIIFSYLEDDSSYQSQEDEEEDEMEATSANSAGRRQRRSVQEQTLQNSTNTTILSPNATIVVAPAPPRTTPPSHLCHREEWEVDGHDDIEWYDLLSPRRLELGFCTGSCPFPLQSDHYNYTLHSFFKDRHRLVKIFGVPKNFPKSCCVPIAYKPIKAWLMEEENSFVMRIFHDVAVDQCGCR